MSRPCLFRPTRSLFHAVVAVALAVTYFAFRIEPFDDEVDDHQGFFAFYQTIGPPSLSWESFDKENAPQAFTIRVLTSFELSFPVIPAPEPARQDLVPYQPVRDKSPPSPAPQV